MNPTYQLVLTTEDLRRVTERLAALSVVGFDTETTSLDPYDGRVRLIQFAAQDAVYIIDLDRFRGAGDMAHVESLAPLRQLLAAARPVKIAHNAKFDAKWIRHTLGVELGGIFDTLLASQLISAGSSDDRHSLEAVVGRYLGQALDKSSQLSDWSGELSDTQLEYAGRDASVLLPLRERMITKLKAEDLVRVAQLEFECVMPVAALELAGFYLDAARWREQMTVIEHRRKHLAEDLQAMLSEGTSQGSLFSNARTEVNIDSHTQLTAALTRLGVPVPDSTRNWKLQPLAVEYPVVAKLLEYRTVQKALTSYGGNILEEINPHTGRIHANFHQIGAPTGRMSCTRPNIQQVPHEVEYRRCFRAPEGRKLIIADYCVAAGTRIATTRGLVSVEEMNIEDRVFLEDGSTAPVTALIRRGHLPVVTIKLKNGYALTATTLHRVRVLDAAGDYVWRRIGEIKASDFVAIQPERGLHDALPYVELPRALWKHFNNNKDLVTPLYADERLAVFLGYMTGDGCFRHRTLNWVVNQQDDDVALRLRELAGELFGITVHRCGVYRGVSEHGLYSTPLVEWCAGIGATKESVPDFLWRSKPTVVAAYLRGLFEADGSVTDSDTGKVSFASSRRKLAVEVHQLLLALGVPATLRQQQDTGPDKRFCCWSVSVVAAGLESFAAKINFLSERKRQKLARLTARATGKTIVGNMPNLQYKVRALGLSGETRRLLNNTATLGRPVSRSLAYTLELIAPEVARSLGLKRLTEHRQIFLPVVAVKDAGEQEVFDLSVPGSMTYISDGFVSHNSQVELRILAEVTGDAGFVEAFRSGADLHRVTSAQVFGVKLEDVTAEQRSFAKRLNFGVVYGIGANRFSAMTGLSLSEAEDIMRRYFKTYHALNDWLRAAAQSALREREARTMAGRLARFHFDPADKQAASLAQRNGKNMPIQGAAADIFKRALRLLHDRINGTSTRIVNIVHDEIVVEVDADESDATMEIVKRAMREAGAEFVKQVPVEVEACVADEWVK
ncbi:MAG: DNA polymerase [Pyrinomonadaceae bacterium MAG19_C2-C3]|nr:DNA polymerase [Pyrinomonadaceae bacterium MAG19_C2-C3]